jgi:ribosomal protein L21E
MEVEYLYNDKYINVHNQLHSTRVDARKCHMSEENNFIFYRKIIKFLSGEPVHIDVNDFVKPTMPLDHYWRLKS